MFFTRFSFCNPYAVDGGTGVLGALRQRRLAFPIRRTNQPGKTLRHSLHADDAPAVLLRRLQGLLVAMGVASGQAALL
jgi:hypothetical protein